MPGRRHVAIATVVLVALTPCVVSIGGYGYNDGLSYASCDRPFWP